MKKILLLISLAILFFSCKKYRPDPQALSVSSTAINGSSGAFKDTVQINADGKWSIDVINLADWLAISNTSGSGNASVVVSAGANDHDERRSAGFKITTSYASKTITVTQEGNSDLNTNKPITIDLKGHYLDLSNAGKADYMYVEGNRAIDFPAGKSFSISLKLQDIPFLGTTQPRVLYWSNGTAYIGLLIDRNGNDGKLCWFLVDKNGKTLRGGPLGSSGAAGQNVTTTTVKDGKWHHIVLVFDADNKESYIYVDGKKQGTVVQSPSFGGLSINGNLLVGDFTKNDPNWDFGGYIDDLRFWSKALTQKEVYADAANIRSQSDAGNLITGWDFEKQNGNKVSDVTSTYDGVLMNGASLGTNPNTGSPYNLLEDKMLFPKGEVNGETYWYYCPALATLPNGDILIASDQRISSPSDVRSNPNIGLAIRRSTDSGKTWSDMQMVNSPNSGVSDPSFIVDKKTGNIFLFGAAYINGVHHMYYWKSTDNGNTWGDYIDPSREILKGSGIAPGFQFFASGRGLYTRDGKLMHIMINVGAGGYFVVSSDDGNTWTLKKDANGLGLSPADESKIVELNDGTLMVNARASLGGRYVYRSTDGGNHWSKNFDTHLPDPICNAGLISYTQERDGFKKNRLLFSNCANGANRTRNNLTVRISYDGGLTWPYSKMISVPAGYSSMTILKDGTIGLAYSYGDAGTRFVRFTLKYLTNGQDSLQVHNF